MGIFAGIVERCDEERFEFGRDDVFYFFRVVMDVIGREFEFAREVDLHKRCKRVRRAPRFTPSFVSANMPSEGS